MKQLIIYGGIALSFAACAINGEILRPAEKKIFSQDRIIYPGEIGAHEAGKVLGAGAVIRDNFIYIGGSTDYQADDYFSSTCDVLTLGKEEDSTHSHTVFDKCLDLPRSSFAATVLNDETMLVFGGSIDGGINTDTVDVLSLEKQASGVLSLHVTSEAGKIGKSKSFAQAVSTKNYAYVVGGIHDILMENSDIDYFYLTSSKQLKRKTIKYNNLRLFHTLVATENKVFIAGGFTSTFESDLVEVYSENKHYFAGGFLAPMHLSAPRQGLTGAGNKQMLMFAGGAYDKDHDFDGKINFVEDKNWKCAESTTKCVSSHVDIYSLNDGTWTLESLSEARTSLASSSNERYFVFAGGLLEDETTISSKLDVYDTSSGLWEVYELPLARYMAEVVIVNSRVFVAGGIVHDTDSSDGEEFSTTSMINIFDLKTKQWLASDYLNFEVGTNTTY